MPRQTTDKKDEKLKLRLNEEMRRHVEIMAKSREVSMSEYIRYLIARDMNR